MDKLARDRGERVLVAKVDAEAPPVCPALRYPQHADHDLVPRRR